MIALSFVCLGGSIGQCCWAMRTGGGCRTTHTISIYPDAWLRMPQREQRCSEMLRENTIRVQLEFRVLDHGSAKRIRASWTMKRLMYALSHLFFAFSSHQFPSKRPVSRKRHLSLKHVWIDTHSIKSRIERYFGSLQPVHTPRRSLPVATTAQLADSFCQDPLLWWDSLSVRFDSLNSITIRRCIWYDIFACDSWGAEINPNWQIIRVETIKHTCPKSVQQTIQPNDSSSFRESQSRPISFQQWYYYIGISEWSFLNRVLASRRWESRSISEW